MEGMKIGNFLGLNPATSDYKPVYGVRFTKTTDGTHVSLEQIKTMECVHNPLKCYP